MCKEVWGKDFIKGFGYVQITVFHKPTELKFCLLHFHWVSSKNGYPQPLGFHTISDILYLCFVCNPHQFSIRNLNYGLFIVLCNLEMNGHWR